MPLEARQQREREWDPGMLTPDLFTPGLLFLTLGGPGAFYSLVLWAMLPAAHGEIQAG